MKKIILSTLFLLVSTAVSASYVPCVFKDLWDLRDMEITEIKTFDKESELMEIQKLQLKAIGQEWGEDDPHQIIDDTDDNSIELYQIIDLAHSRVYDYYQYYSGDTQVGVIFVQGTTIKVGENGDQSFYCDLEYQAFEKLPIYFFTPTDYTSHGACYFGDNIIDLARRKQFTFSEEYRILDHGTAVDFYDSNSGLTYTLVMGLGYLGGPQNGEIKLKETPGFIVAQMKNGAFVECADSFWDRGWDDWD